MNTNFSGLQMFGSRYESEPEFECRNGHVCLESEIPPEGLDIYCPTCGSTLDLIDTVDTRQTTQVR